MVLRGKSKTMTSLNEQEIAEIIEASNLEDDGRTFSRAAVNTSIRLVYELTHRNPLWSFVQVHDEITSLFHGRVSLSRARVREDK